MHLSEHLQFFTALFIILNPIGIAPLFATMTGEMTPPERNRTALITAVAVFLTCGACAVGGRAILGFFGINVDDLRVAGGLVVLLIGLGMVNAQPDRTKHTPAETADARSKDNPAVVPLAIPLTSGPGAMATAILSTGGARTLADFTIVGITILACSVLVYLIYRGSTQLQQLLGVSGMGVLTRIMGLIVAAIAVEMIAAGLRNLFPLL